MAVSEVARLGLVGLVVAAWLGEGQVARADVTKGGQAEQLFREATVALERKRYDEACPKLEESNRLARALGTEYNLAVCWELSRRVASARRMYRSAAELARATGRTSVADDATKRILALEKVVPRLVVTFKGDVAGVRARCDEQPLDPAPEPVTLELDPGKHRLVATKAERTAFQLDVTLAEAELREVVVDLPAAPVATTLPPAVARPPAATAPAEAPPAFPWRPTGIAVAAVGVATIGVGAFFALRAKSDRDASGCREGRICVDEATASQLRDAKHEADVATVLVVVGGALLATGGAFFLFAGHPQKTVTGRAAPWREGLRLTPRVSPQGASLGLHGSF